VCQRVPAGRIGRLRDDGVRVAEAYADEDERQRRVRPIAVTSVGHPPAGAPPRSRGKQLSRQAVRAAVMNSPTAIRPRWYGSAGSGSCRKEQAALAQETSRCPCDTWDDNWAHRISPAG
jgi:hypothetical protein